MKISRKIINYKENNIIKLGDLIENEGYLFMIVKEDYISIKQEEVINKYRLLRLRDGASEKRYNFVNTLIPKTYDSIEQIIQCFEDKKTYGRPYRIIPGEKLSLILNEGE